MKFQAFKKLWGQMAPYSKPLLSLFNSWPHHSRLRSYSRSKPGNHLRLHSRPWGTAFHMLILHRYYLRSSFRGRLRSRHRSKQHSYLRSRQNSCLHSTMRNHLRSKPDSRLRFRSLHRHTELHKQIVQFVQKRFQFLQTAGPAAQQITSSSLAPLILWTILQSTVVR